MSSILTFALSILVVLCQGMPMLSLPSVQRKAPPKVIAQVGQGKQHVSIAQHGWTPTKAVPAACGPKAQAFVAKHSDHAGTHITLCIQPTKSPRSPDIVTAQVSYVPSRQKKYVTAMAITDRFVGHAALAAKVKRDAKGKVTHIHIDKGQQIALSYRPGVASFTGAQQGTTLTLEGVAKIQ